MNSGRWYPTWTSFSSIEELTMSKKMFGNGARRIVLFTLALLAPCAQNTLFGQALSMDGQSGNFFQPSADVDAAQNEVADPTHDNDPIEEKTTPSPANAADSWGPFPTKKPS